MRKKIMSLMAIALATIMIIPGNVFAEHYTGGDNWNVYFDGKKMVSSFKSSDIDDAVYQMQPGDDVTITVKLQNKYSETTNWWMSNEVLQSLEESEAAAQNGGYTYKLTYTAKDGKTTSIYDSDTVGGETISKAGDEGLHQATNSLEDFFYLDQLAKGDEGVITLVVGLDGETQGNAYQDTLAKLQMNFATELATKTVEVVPPTNKTPTPTKHAVTSVKTGDYQQTMMWSMIALAAGVICVILVVFKVRKSKGHGTETIGQSNKGGDA